MTPPRSIFAAKLCEFPEVAFAAGDAVSRRGSWHDHFLARVGPRFTGRLVFEVGCNDADFLTRVAAKHPQTAFVGLDWKCKAIYDAAARVTELRLRNVALVRGRAQDVAKLFGTGEVDEVWIFHPDPCDNPAELKNRLIAEPFLSDVHSVLRNASSTLALKTDHPGYYQWTLSLLGLVEPDSFATARAGANAAPGLPRVRDLMNVDDLPAASEAVRRLFDPLARSADFWNDEGAKQHAAPRMFAGEQTAFEARFVRKRRPIYFVELRKR